MEELIALARQLGQQISAHERTQQLKQVQKKVDADGEAAKLVQAYQEQMQHLADLERRNKPIEVDDKRKLRDLEEKIAAHPTLGELTRRQVDFVEMMRKIKDAIDGELQVSV